MSAVEHLFAGYSVYTTADELEAAAPADDAPAFTPTTTAVTSTPLCAVASAGTVATWAAGC